MPTTFTERDEALDQVKTRITTETGRLAELTTIAQLALENLQGIATDYGAIIAEIESDAVANPGDSAMQVQNDRAQKYVADFIAAQAKANAIIAAGA